MKTDIAEAKKIHINEWIDSLPDEVRRMNRQRIEDIKLLVNRKLSEFSLDREYHNGVHTFVEEAHALLMSPQAKRVRGIIPVMLAQDMDFKVDDCVIYSVVIELLHFTSLVHDDVIDDHETRRGLPTLNHLFTNSTAVLTGDYLMYEVINHCLSFEYGTRVIDLVVKAAKDMVAGVVMEQNVLPSDASLANYVEMARRKTGSLFALSFGLPFVFDEKRLRDVTECGRLFGILFQIYDDHMDQDSDRSHENIFQMSSLGKIREVIADSTDNMLEIGKSVGIDGTILNAADFLMDYGYFVDI